jgi:hypothetical protein
MRRWVFAFLLFVVPFQLVWGSAAPYCAHEESASAVKHFGHHEHKHQTGGEVTPAAGDQSDDAGAYHADCESCHLGCSAVLRSNAPEVHALPLVSALGYRGPSFTSHVPSGPHRPDRADPAPAARFGGGVVVVSLAG